MERITNTHVFFWGSEFSNWYECKFTYLDNSFSNSEQAFMSRKAAYFEDWNIFDKILKEGDDPYIAKKLGRQIKNFNADLWMEVCFDEMVDVNLAKYSQNPELKKLLLSTGNKTLVEASPFDKIWGIGLHWNDDKCLDESKWKGTNLLGKALMEVRTKLK